MKIRKIVEGHEIILELVKIKDYANFSLYQVYKIIDNKHIPIYKTCL